MIKAYSQNLLDASETVKASAKWNSRNLISREQLEKIKGKFSDFYFSPNVFVRIGLFLFTLFLSFSFMGLASLFLFVGMTWQEGKFLGTILLSYGAIHFIVLEYLIRKRKLYRAGIDDALLYMGLGLIISGLVIMFGVYNSSLICTQISLIVCGLGMLRYADRLVTFNFLTSVLSVIFFSLVDAPFGRSLLPFIFMVVSASIYFLSNSFKDEQFRYWKGCIKVMKIFSLLSFYLSGNLYVIVVVNRSLSGHLPDFLRGVFLAFTVLVPLFFIYLGLLKKDRLFLVTGMIILALGVLTIKYFYSIASAEFSLSIGGVFLIIIAYCCIKYLKTPRYGFTFQQPESENRSDAEGLIIGQTLAGLSTGVKNEDVEMGGGDFGGGGAGSSY